MEAWWKSVKTVRAHYAEKKKATRKQNRYTARCVVCQELFKRAREHAACCSAKCRMRRHRLANK